MATLYSSGGGTATTVSTAYSGTKTADWFTAETDLVTINPAGARYKVHLLIVDINNLVGNISIRMYMQVNGVERIFFPVPLAQTFDVATHGAGICVINGTLGIHSPLRVTVQSDNAADNAKAVAYDYMLEAT